MDFEYKKINNDKYFSQYELISNYIIVLNVKPLYMIYSKFYEFNPNGELKIFSGYHWFGGRCPIINNKNTVKVSCVHNILYKMIRNKDMNVKLKKNCDKELKRIFLEEGGQNIWNKIRSIYFYCLLRLSGFISCR